MKKINILSAELSNKIAAGEVVERPASVVKELIENSIDAKSTNIKIFIKEFGVREIRIVDNGNGISNDDIKTAFLRHATSKINSDYDLFHINTLGFRGEALASIASVSKVIIKSCSGESQGKILEINGGKITSEEFYAPIKGTDISVQNLFYNTPARLKYLRNSNTEQANIMNIINKFVMSYPNISFEVHIDGKIALKTYGDGNLHKVLSKVYSNNIAKNMLEFSGQNDDYSIEGYISVPEETRASKNYINIFINGRYIKNYIIQNTIVAAYGTFLMKNRYPIVVINIKMNPILLDVNVHPTKQEVRLSKEEELTILIKNVISTRLSNYTYIPQGINNVLTKKQKEIVEQIDFSEELDNKFIFGEDNTVVVDYPNESKNSLNNKDISNNNQSSNSKNIEELPTISYNYRVDKKTNYSINYPNGRKNSAFKDNNNNTLNYSKNNNINTKKEKENFLEFIKPNVKENTSIYNTSNLKKEEKVDSDLRNEKNDTSLNNDIKTKDKLVTKTLPELQVLAQLFKTYILAQTGNELYLIDQHAAAERYNYEKLQKSFSEEIVIQKQLLVPITFDFSIEEAVEIKNNINKLNKLGIRLEEFGTESFVLREIPNWVTTNENMVKDMIQKVLDNKNITYIELRNDAIAMASCKMSIKANQVLTEREQNKVIEDLYKCDNPFTCPHGRPIITKMDKKDLEKMFKRIV